MGSPAPPDPAMPGPPERSGSPERWARGVLYGTCTLVGLLALAMADGGWGFAAILAAPFVAGLIIGRWVRVQRVAQIFAAIVLAVSVIAAAVLWDLAGWICGVIIGALIAIPLLLGVLVGSRLFGNTRPRTSFASIALVALLIPVEQAIIPPAPVEAISTSVVVAMSAADAYERIHFYEDAEGVPPRLLRVALPRPIRTIGEPRAVGDIVRCLYDTGYIVKEITALEPARRYAFRVIEQNGVEEHAIALVDGSFQFQPVGAARTRLVLTTRYRPKLTARVAWRPFEEAVVHTLHRHVIRSMTAARD